MSSETVALSPLRTNLARAVSDVFSPPVLAIPALLLGVWASRETGTYRFALVYFCVAVLTPVLYVIWGVRTGRISDFHMADRRERIGPFVASILSGLAGLGLLVKLGAPSEFVAPILALLTQTLLLFLITLSWQVSVHTATTASLLTFACLTFGFVAAAFLWLIPLVAWARIYLGRHTVSQTIAGAGLGATCFVLLFALHGILW